MLENFYYYNFHGKSIPGEVLALGLLPSVFGAGHGPDGPGFPETPSNLYIYKIVAKKVLCPLTPPRASIPQSWNLACT